MLIQTVVTIDLIQIPRPCNPDITPLNVKLLKNRPLTHDHNTVWITAQMVDNT